MMGLLFEQMKIAAADNLKLPKDVILGEALVSFIGRTSVIVENYRGILIYDDQTVNCSLKENGFILIIITMMR